MSLNTMVFTSNMQMCYFISSSVYVNLNITIEIMQDVLVL